MAIGITIAKIPPMPNISAIIALPKIIKRPNPTNI